MGVKEGQNNMVLEVGDGPSRTDKGGVYEAEVRGGHYSLYNIGDTITNW
jgi:hypothetical protein